MTEKIPIITPDEERFLEEQITREIIDNERRRALILGIVSTVLLIVIALFVLLLYERVNKLLPGLFPVYVTMGVLAVLTWRAHLIRLALKGKRLQKIMSNKIKRDFIRYAWIFFEVSIPSVLLVVYSAYFSNPIILSTPIVWFYFVVIILSILSLDFYISLFCGITAAVEYLLVVYFIVGVDSTMPTGLPDLFSYVSRGVMLFLSGGAAGVAAYQLRKKITSTYTTLFERNKIVNLFDQQVSKEIVDELISNYNELRSKRKFVCVMFLDIRDFTPFAEKREPEEIIQYQNQVFSFMIEIITSHHGIINQFLGDGYMATFGAPLSRGNDCQNAVDAALEIIRTVELKNASGEIPKTKVGIGLHAGEVVAGNVGTDIRKQYSISGNTVILASRIEELNKKFGSQLLISKEVLERIIPPDNCEYKGAVQLKGREKPIDIYKLA